MQVFLGFFDYKDGNVGEMFSIGHIIYMIIALAILIILPIVLRKVSHKKIDIYLKVTSIVVPLTDLVKIIWETYHYRANGYGTFEYTGLLPLYLCSLFMICMPFAAYCKGKVRDIALSFLTTIGIVGGISNVFYLNMLNYYPLIHYATFSSIFYHIMMVFTGIWLLSSGYYKLNKFSPLKAIIPVLLLSLIAIPVNSYLNTDYMLLNRADGAPLLPIISSFLKNNNLGFLFIFVMFGVYIGVGYLIFGIYKLIEKK